MKDAVLILAVLLAFGGFFYETKVAAPKREQGYVERIAELDELVVEEKNKASKSRMEVAEYRKELMEVQNQLRGARNLTQDKVIRGEIPEMSSEPSPSMADEYKQKYADDRERERELERAILKVAAQERETISNLETEIRELQENERLHREKMSELKREISASFQEQRYSGGRKVGIRTSDADRQRAEAAIGAYQTQLEAINAAIEERRGMINKARQDAATQRAALNSEYYTN